MSEKALIDTYTDMYCNDPTCIYPCAAERNAMHYIKEIKAAVWRECVEAHSFVRGGTIPQNPYE